MSGRGSFDLSKINNPSDITREVIRKLSAQDAMYLREKFGDQLDSFLAFKVMSEEFTIEDTERLKSFESKSKK